MRRGSIVALAPLAALVAAVAVGCGTENASDSCNKGEELEEALQELDQLVEDDTSAANVDTKLEELGEQVNDVMNTGDDENALHPADADVRYQDVRDTLEDLGNAEDIGETGEALSDGLDQVAEAFDNMAEATSEECTP
jgi:hypothetical protein